MDILVNNKICKLSITDPKTGIDWTRDLLGNADALNYDNDLEQYTMDIDEYNWWLNYINI